MKEFFEKLLTDGIVTEHYTYKQTGIVCGNLEKISGTAGKNVDHFYYDPRENKIDVCHNNIHYGYAHIEDGIVVDNSNRAKFKIV